MQKPYSKFIFSGMDKKSWQRHFVIIAKTTVETKPGRTKTSTSENPFILISLPPKAIKPNKIADKIA